MALNIRFDTTNNTEIIYGKIFPLGTNFINFISINMENILNDEIISNLSKNNCERVLSRIATASNDIIILQILYPNIATENLHQFANIKEIKKDLTNILKVYNKFRKLTDFCYFNDNSKVMTPLRWYIYYLHKYNIEKIVLPKQTINSFGLKPHNEEGKLITNNDMLTMIQENSPFFYFNYECINIDEFMMISFLKLIENNYCIAKCKNCNKYFIAYNRTDTLYCDRISPQDSTKTCKQYGVDKAWWERTKDENDWYSLYRKVYQSFQMKAKRNPKLKKKDFDNFRKEANEWKQEVKKGTKTEADFMKWLQEFRKNK